MAELKTKQTEASVEKYLDTIEDPRRRADCVAISALMKRVTRFEPKMWGPSIVGFGTQHYKYASGREGDWPISAFSPRKRDLTVYLMVGFDKNTELMEKLGKHSTGKSCLYIKRLSDIDVPTLRKLIKESVKGGKP